VSIQFVYSPTMERIFVESFDRSIRPDRLTGSPPIFRQKSRPPWNRPSKQTGVSFLCLRHRIPSEDRLARTRFPQTKEDAGCWRKLTFCSCGWGDFITLSSSVPADSARFPNLSFIPAVGAGRTRQGRKERPHCWPASAAALAAAASAAAMSASTSFLAQAASAVALRSSRSSTAALAAAASLVLTAALLAVASAVAMINLASVRLARRTVKH
jgi:hypothetical protein